MEKKNLRRLSILVTAQTAANLERLTQIDRQASIGRTVDKLVREKVLSLHQRPSSWDSHYLARFKKVL